MKYPRLINNNILSIKDHDRHRRIFRYDRVHHDMAAYLCREPITKMHRIHPPPPLVSPHTLNPHRSEMMTSCPNIPQGIVVL